MKTVTEALKHSNHWLLPMKESAIITVRRDQNRSAQNFFMSKSYPDLRNIYFFCVQIEQLVLNINTWKHLSASKEAPSAVKNYLQTISQKLYIYIYIYIYHHHIALVARISLTLSRHSSLSFIALGRSSGQHPVYSHSCWMYVRAGRPAFARPCVGVHKSTSLMSSSLLLQQCPACLVRLTWIVFVIGGRWPYSWCLVGCCRQDLFKIARSILV